MSSDRPATRLATRLAFLVAGFGVACWAPLVPFAKARLGVDDAVLGALLLCVGLGSVIAMLITGPLGTRYGSRPIIVAGGVALAAILPLLSVANTTPALGFALLAFGAALGSLDVAMNVHAIEVEHAAARPLMSGFHALFSVGGIAGSSVMTFLLSMRVGAFASTLLCSAPMLAAILVARPRLLRAARAAARPRFAMPRGVVPLLAMLAAITFLAEGALLDWSALLITDKGLVAAAQGGLGYLLFSIAMTAGRLGGDAISARVGDRSTMFWGGLLAVAGFVMLLAAPIAGVAMAGFLLIGLGASNIVPVLFRRAGAQQAMPSALAVTLITITGYAGHLAGPAGMGFVARSVGLESAFWMLAALLGIVPLCARVVTANRT
ncbi:MFS transporter [Burkholderia pseudomallei]|uniref:MFS transporter n=1 Tax=Burkholderia pseudomallei TaxID=28450 RepID=UPI0005D8F3B0|nr:MFS transporter [Burkholderia pseudomallei]AJW56140.1 MFS transporter [Burkholderia pseudomallei]MBF3395445.1 MFS transporter [Burkholderia pseudomallei]MBF3401007.1 MFS transporter [Burkholderia pseudomallei]MBF3473354.1 MFS transporter [Burkholderia pseudomallei]MBF3528765.1 MFS transporter [Burkholderia pseudomallei]